MNYDLVIKNASAVVPSEGGDHGLKVERLDVAIKDGKIAGVGSFDKASEVIDANGLHLLPGVIDSQVHFREPGLEHKEDLATGMKGALKGGVTTVFEMPNTNPSTTTQEAFEEKIRRGQEKAWTHFAFFIGASPENIDELSKLEKLPGCCGVKIFMGSSTGNLLVEKDEDLEKILAGINRRVAVHCEDEQRLRDRKSVSESGSVLDHPNWRDEETALLATTRLLRLSKKLNQPVHVLHITTKSEIEALGKAKAEGIPCTVECTPQHLTLFAPDCYEQIGSKAQMNPPVRTKDHQDGLWKGIADGTVDVIGSDHAPHTLEEKAKPYPQSPSGMTGVQTMLPIMLDHVNNGKLSLEHLVSMLCQKPAEIYNLKGRGKIEVGAYADLTLINLEKEFEIKDEWIESRCGWTPFHGKKVRGWPMGVFLRGEKALWDGEFVGSIKGQRCEFEV